MQKAQLVDQSEMDDLGGEEVICVEREKQKSLGLEVYQYQVSGKTPKYIDNLHGYIYKNYSHSEHQFYQFLKNLPQSDIRAQLRGYVPEYLGIYGREQLEGISEIKSPINQLPPANSKELPPANSKQLPPANQKQLPPANQKQLQTSEQGHRSFWIEHITSREEIEAEGQKYICLRNLTYRYQNPNILDLKLGRKKPKKSNVKFEGSTTNSHCFRINGMVTQLHNSQKYQQFFLSKYFGQKITLDQIQDYLALFFFNGKAINKELLLAVTAQLSALLQCFRQFRAVRFISSSLFISYDADMPQHFVVKLIDFDKYEHEETLGEDANVSEGLENVQRFLGSIAGDIAKHQAVLLHRDLQIFKGNVLVVPQAKISKYQPK